MTHDTPAQSETQTRHEELVVDRGAVLVDQPRTYRYLVKKGDTFSGILDAFGVNRVHSHTLFQHLRKSGFTALFPGDSIVFDMSPDGAVRVFSLLNRAECWFHVWGKDQGYASLRKPLAVTVHRCMVKGTLKSSLSQSMASLGEGHALAAQLVDIFAWDINFFIDPREGDSFEVVFEKQFAEGKFSGYGKILAARYMNDGRDHIAIGMSGENGAFQYYSPSGKSVQKQFLKAPLSYNRVSSGFSNARRHPVLGIVRPHQGIDYAAPRGTPIYAAADGVVRFAGVKGGYGKFVEIAHGASYTTTYGHLSVINSTVRPGSKVTQGQSIGKVGSTGLSTGPHLDYRMTVAGRFVDPRKVNLPSKAGVSEVDFPRFAAIRNSSLLLFSSRFTSAQGSWVLDIQGGEQAVSEPAILLSRGESASGNTSGS